MKKPHFISVRGKKHEWVFNVLVDPKHVAEIREDGIEIYVLSNSVPAWIASMGLTVPWCFFQDLFHLKNPFQDVRFRL